MDPAKLAQDGGCESSVWTRRCVTMARSREVSPRTQTRGDAEDWAMSSQLDQQAQCDCREYRADSTAVGLTLETDSSSCYSGMQVQTSPLDLTRTTVPAHRPVSGRARVLQKPVVVDPSQRARSPLALSALTRSYPHRASGRGAAAEEISGGEPSLADPPARTNSTNTPIAIPNPPNGDRTSQSNGDRTSQLWNPHAPATRPNHLPTLSQRISADTAQSNTSASTTSTSKFALESPSTWTRRTERRHRVALNMAIRLSLTAKFDAPSRAEEEVNHENLRSRVRSEVGSSCGTNSALRVACPFCMFPRFPRAPRRTVQCQDEFSVEEEVTLMRRRTPDGRDARRKFDRVGRRKRGGVKGRRKCRKKKERSRALNRPEIWLLVLSFFACELLIGLFTLYAAGASGAAIWVLHIPSYMAVGAFICNAFTAAPTATTVEDPERQALLGEGRRRQLNDESESESESGVGELVFEWRRSV